MKKKWLKKGSAVLLAVAMVLSLFPGTKRTLATVQAAENTEPASEFWTTAEKLKEFGISSSKTIGKIKFGASGRIWAICGAYGDNLALLSTSEFTRAIYGLTSEYSQSSFVNGIDTYLGTTYFSTGETGKMADVTVTTNEPDVNTAVPVPDKKLYLPNSYDQRTAGATIYVGSNNDIPVSINKLTDANGFQTNPFWLRSPYGSDKTIAFGVRQSATLVSSFRVNDDSVSVVPAFDLKLLSVYFASAVDPAASDGYTANTDMKENTYTLRYKSGGSEQALVDGTGSSITITGATDTMYLVAQNSTGAYAKKLTRSTTSVNASDIDGIDNFNNCKVWLESTTDRITTATLATQKKASVTITPGANMTIDTSTGAASQTDITGDMAEVIYNANSGYYFPSDYSVTSVDGISVTRVSASQIKVSGSPTAVSVGITLTDATKKGTADTPTIDIDYVNEALTGFDTSKTYSINNGTAFTPTGETLAIDNSYFGTTITIKETESETILPSADQYLQIADRPLTPQSVTGNNESVDGKGDGSITGVDSTMEYSSDQISWTSATGNTISNLADGTYYVRYKVVEGTSFAGSVAKIIIYQGVAKKVAVTVTAPTFTDGTEGYTRPEAQNITIDNDTANGANWDAIVSGVTLTGTDAASFTITKSGSDWTIQPVAGLTANVNGTAKTYIATINVAYDATEGITSPATTEVSFTVNPKSNTVTVTSGTGSATYNKGATVTAIANAAGTGYAFKEWTGIDGLTLLDGTTTTSTTIKFTMPEEAVNITATYKDVAAPSAIIKVKSNTWNQILNTITFGHFFKDTQIVTITGTDNESGVKKIEYYLADAEISNPSSITNWTTYDSTFNIDPARKYVIYARVTDNGDNTIIVNSNGIIVYQDATADTTSIQYVKAAPSDLTAKVNLNGNTVKDIKNDVTTIDTANYSVADDGTITFMQSYLDTLTVEGSPYTFTISYNPLGESIVAAGDNDDPNPTTLYVTVVNGIAPTITTQPVNVTVIEGNTATFTVAATGTPAPTYQWQIKKDNTWEDIDTATSASYTTSATVKANSGYRYRCVVTNGEGSVDSNEATLTVTDVPVVTYNVNVATDGNGTAVANITTAASGTKVTLTATPKDGYQFKRWQVISGGVAITNDAFTMPASDVSVKAIFEKKAVTPTGPFIVGDNGTIGWDAIKDKTTNAATGNTIIVDMNGTTEVPGAVIDSIKGKDVNVVFDLGNGIKWVVNGQSVIKDGIAEIDFDVTTGTNTIPVDVVNEVTGEKYSIQISLAYNGEFGFTATLSINMNAKNSGYYANLYYYNKSTGKLEFMNASKIDKNGNVELTFTHASDYTIVVSDKAMNETETPTPETPSTTPTDTNSPKTGDNSPILLWVLVLIGAGIGVTALASKKSKKETK